jgi:ABC-type nitrate/sulfonate/bicarbonate transport system substrate-binding protein
MKTSKKGTTRDILSIELFDRRRFLKGAAIAGVSLAVAVAFPGCGDGNQITDSTGLGENEDTSADTKGGVLKFPGLKSQLTTLNPIAIAYSKGYYEEESITIEDIGELGSGTEVAALLDDTANIVVLMTADAVKAVDSGADIVQIGTLSNSTEEIPHTSFFTLEGSSITKPEDLRGKTVGIGFIVGCTIGFVYEQALRAGIEDPEKEIEIIVAQENTLVEGLKRGDYDVVAIHLPAAVAKKVYPETQFFFSDYTFGGGKFGDAAIYANRKFAEANPALIDHFLRAEKKAHDYVVENPEVAREEYFDYVEDASKDLLLSPYPAPDALVDYSHIQSWIDSLSSGKNYETLQHTDLKAENLGTNRYNPYSDEYEGPWD